ncbi:MAG: hypothetical protein FWG66_00475 [Spirochaetes bacterium]|nr:hypothetical protein [Spirochaetota bacterium]
MLGDILCLDVDAEIFLQKSMDDLKFINGVLEILAEKLTANPDFPNRDREADNIMDAEWQFRRLLSEFSNSHSPFSAYFSQQSKEFISSLVAQSNKRRDSIDKFSTHIEQYEPGAAVSRAELSGLLESV